GGVFKTTDGGKNWARLTNGLPPGNVVGRIGIAIAASNPKVVYAFIDNYDVDPRQGGGRNPAGGNGQAIKGDEVYRSDDKGATWRLVSGQDDAQRTFMKGVGATYAWVFGNVRVDPTDENHVYLLSFQAVSSSDGGKTFGAFLPAPPAPAGGAGGAGGAGAAGG